MALRTDRNYMRYGNPILSQYKKAVLMGVCLTTSTKSNSPVASTNSERQADNSNRQCSKHSLPAHALSHGPKGKSDRDSELSAKIG